MTGSSSNTGASLEKEEQRGEGRAGEGRGARLSPWKSRAERLGGMTVLQGGGKLLMWRVIMVLMDRHRLPEESFSNRWLDGWARSVAVLPVFLSAMVSWNSVYGRLLDSQWSAQRRAVGWGGGGVGGLGLALALSSDKARGKNSLTLQGKDLTEGMMVVLAAGLQTWGGARSHLNVSYLLLRLAFLLQVGYCH